VDKRHYFNILIYSYFFLAIGFCFIPENLFPESLVQLGQHTSVARHHYDLFYLRNSSYEGFYSIYSTVYFLQFGAFILFMSAYIFSAFTSTDVKYAMEERDSYFISSTIYIFVICFVFSVLFFTSDFGFFEYQHSWFEDNPNADTRLLPMQETRGSLVFTGMAFAAAFSSATVIVENLVSWAFGLRVQHL